ncbi:unnamed protein product [Dovyalis caffra]|uniref:F-box domain-containing protein n=1 Tax=Dovyalis caffra TaxID=77055 RepID=A0AAV1SK46_9ROSI|nr:unnamed protein product [Dovyalis caffra]
MAGDSEKASRSRDQSLVSFFNKRTRIDNPSSSSSPSSSESSKFCLNDLKDLLIEVFQRLPTTKSAILCKCVCKNWYSLISTPFFACRFITHNFNRQYKQNPSALIINFLDLTGNGVLAFSDEPIFKFSGFGLNYLPERKGLVKVSAIFNDLMLCSVDDFGVGKIRYYICNPFTMQWVSSLCMNMEEAWNIKTMWDLFVSLIILKIAKENVPSIADIVLEGSGYEWLTNVVEYNRKLLWYNGKQFFAYDPFNPELSTFIDCSYIQSTKILYTGDYRIGVCQGFLHLMEFVDLGNSRTLIIWKLRDYDKWEWSLEDHFDLDAMIPGSPLVQAILGDSEHMLGPLAFHPCDGDIVYLHFENFVISCNRRTKELRMAGTIPGDSYFYSLGKVFHIELPLWPTPIASPIEILPFY